MPLWLHVPMDIDGHFHCIIKFVRTKLLENKSIWCIILCRHLYRLFCGVDTPRTHKNAHIFLSFHVLRDGQGEPAAPTLIRLPSLVRHFSGGHISLRKCWNLDSDSMDILDRIDWNLYQIKVHSQELLAIIEVSS